MMRFLADENLHIEIVRGLRQANYEVLFVPDLGLAGHKDREILEYSEKNDLIVISGDKDFGGLTEFGPLWGRGKVILLRYRLINIQRIVRNILEILDREAETFRKEKAMVIVLSEAGYRIHRRGELTK
jgi:predicted nuclease of predicted toxin-antitoxin system